MASRVPERRCLVSGAAGAADTLIRFAVDPGGNVVPDVAGRLPGRGLWVTAGRGLVDQAVAKKLFARAARRQVRAPQDLAAQTEAALAQRCGEFLGLARRAGEVYTGFDAVAAALASGKVAVLVTAADAGAHGREKLGGKARGLPAVDWLAAEELSLALGRENVVHAALAPGGLGERFLREARRLRGFRGVGEAATAGAALSLDDLSRDSGARSRGGQ